jgi:hypothetical protein
MLNFEEKIENFWLKMKNFVDFLVKIIMGDHYNFQQFWAKT